MLLRNILGPQKLCLGLSPVNFTSPVLHYTEKRKKLIISIAGPRSKPQGCGASVASAAGPFTTGPSPQNKKNCSLSPYVNFFTKHNQRITTLNTYVTIYMDFQ
jgi:hypothetical protein